MKLATKNDLAEAAKTLATSYEMVQYRNYTYIPMDWRTGAVGPTVPENQVWVPLTRDDKRRLGNRQAGILFANDSELTNFDLMLKQFAFGIDKDAEHLLILTDQGLRLLDDEGKLQEPSGQFVPNFIKHELNNDPVEKAAVFEVIKGWLNSEEEAVSLLHHVATALAPGWSAVKYVLLIGDGRNGKSVFLQMVSDLFGAENISSITRQQMADRLPVVTELNGKLLNIIYDGEMAYIKDSSMEKTLIAGEPAQVRMLYENGTTKVQTNALFMEALNSEPKSRDKSGALQKRLSRFWFQNVYALDHSFERMMRQPERLGAFLSLLLDHFVPENQIAEKLTQTQGAIELQVEQELLNSPILQFVQYLVFNDSKMLSRLLEMKESDKLLLQSFVDSFMSWRTSEGYTEYSSADVVKMFRDHFLTGRASFRENGKVIKRPILVAPKQAVQMLLEQLKGDEEDDGL